MDLLIKIHKASSDQSFKLKPIRNGGSVSRQDGEMILDIIETNTNEEELRLLKFIYEVSLEYRDELKERFEK